MLQVCKQLLGGEPIILSRVVDSVSFCDPRTQASDLDYRLGYISGVAQEAVPRT